MSFKSNRKISQKTTLQMLNWAHYQFQQRIINQAKLRNKRVKSSTNITLRSKDSVVVGSITVLGAKKLSNANNACLSVICDRDHGATCSIALKWLSDQCPVKTVSLGTQGATPRPVSVTGVNQLS